MTKEKCIIIFNKNSLNINDLIALLTDFLAEIEYKNISEMVEFIISNPVSIQQAYKKVKEHYCRKHEINRLISDNKVILYY